MGTQSKNRTPITLSRGQAATTDIGLMVYLGNTGRGKAMLRVSGYSKPMYSGSTYPIDGEHSVRVHDPTEDYEVLVEIFKGPIPNEL